MLSEVFHNVACYKTWVWFRKNELYKASSSTEHNKANYDQWKMKKKESKDVLK